MVEEQLERKITQVSKTQSEESLDIWEYSITYILESKALQWCNPINSMEDAKRPNRILQWQPPAGSDIAILC